MKYNILLSESDLNSFCSDWIIPVLQKHFTVIWHHENKPINKKDTIVVTTSLNAKNNWLQTFIEDGYKILIDNLAELRSGDDTENIKYLTCDKWFWVNEALWYIHLKYDTYIPNRTYEKTALMPMRLARYSRDILFQAVQPFLHDFIYSYVDKGIRLPNDKDNEWGGVEQRNFNSLWYDNTCFSLVSESKITSTEMFVTEKTFKTFAHSHPFMVFGIPGTLKFLQNLGFETYENMFDQRYDNITDYRERLNILVDNIKNFTKTPYDALTLQKIEHNKNLFYNQDLIESIIIKEIVEPILEYAET